MILKLTDIVITSTHTGNVWATLVPDADTLSGGLFCTGGYLISAFDTTGRVWISNQSPDGYGEGMETTAVKLADFMRARLFADSKVLDLPREQFNALIADYYRQEF